MRLFIAVDVPDPVKDAAVAAGEELSRIEGRFIPVSRQAMHITLNFIGEADASIAEKAKGALNGVAFSPFELKLRGISYFSPNFVKVVFVDTVGEGRSELTRLYYALGEALKGAGVPYDENEADYTPHLTIARVKYLKDKAAFAEFVERNRERDFGSFKVRSVALKQSVLTENGPVYTDLNKIEF